MRRRTVVSSVTSATVVTVSVLALLAGGAAPAAALVDPVTITVRFYAGTGPGAEATIYRAEDVTVGEGAELTADDLVQPSSQCGSAEVDIDPGARTVTITSTDDGCVVPYTNFVVETSELQILPPTSNGLVTWEPGLDPFFEVDSSYPDPFGAAWVGVGDETMTLSGSSVFPYELVEVEPEPSTSPQPSPSPTARPAEPVPAEADFTG
ncbi:hypothetical protein [Aquipuribacter nitratireducens]|uniref:Uncharacterized protein n=1 Tax=Aquipuribacter nitratireducens TaxID=650104 RepID=A0ABW0GNW4_9MICO